MSDSSNRTPLGTATPAPVVVEGGPLPIDVAAARRVAEAMRVPLSEACRAAGVPDDSG
ncbi:hypothetical protein [Streptomyces sp. NPDC005989]|uniref:hypothetical protein n=1 Tax=Streptomyces sp. NPDC005989 TaxID=3156727 RepID=UPI0033D90D63